MKIINIDLIKDLIISILLVIVIVLIVSIIFYDKISISKIIPETQDYSLTKEMQEDINSVEDLKNTQTDDIDYYIDGYDLKVAEKAGTYSKGKQNPLAFSNYSIYNGNETENNSISNNYDEGVGIK